MGTRVRDSDTAAKVIAWLRSPDGERWSECRIRGLERHWEHSGIFADVIADTYGGRISARARWPEPFEADDLEVSGFGADFL